ncbi:MAG: cell division protein ZapE [Rhodospirillaceae bacterium]|nr:cell division protein ZapE [Rhodospirillaceae bacterium]
MTPLKRYKQDVSEQLVSFDVTQLRAVEAFESLFGKLVLADGSGRQFVSLILRWLSIKLPITGIYLWGGVGRGKTYLMDLFFECIPFPHKQRIHFHRFMFSVHTQLKVLQGRKNPLDVIASRIAKTTRLLCVDEFFVLDIGDAMLLSGLLKSLFDRGIVFVATSNIHPDLLYQDGLQRDSFLPAIQLIKKFTDVIELGGGTDYRLRSLTKATLYHFPHNEKIEKHLFMSFSELVPNPADIQCSKTIEVLGREVSTRYNVKDVIWFDFAVLCSSPRSSADYVELARTCHAVVLSGIPQLSNESDDKARRFVSLIDEFYDRKVKLIISADVEIAKLYSGHKLKFEFERTKSRLIEMQSYEYLASPHVVL